MLQGFDCRVIHNDRGPDGIALDDSSSGERFRIAAAAVDFATLHLIDAAAVARV